MAGNICLSFLSNQRAARHPERSARSARSEGNAFHTALLVMVCLTACRTERVQPPPRAASPWTAATLSDSGFGPIVVGMTPAEANAAVTGALTLPENLGSEGCAYASAQAVPGLLVMIENGHVVRIDVRTNGVATAKGARVGDSEERVAGLYAGRVTTSPHKYTTGHYLTVTSRETAIGTVQLVFETDGKAVTQFRGGRVPQVNYVEGCS